jgi:hypothetical protein
MYGKLSLYKEKASLTVAEMVKITVGGEIMINLITAFYSDYNSFK